ncbi:MAG: FtsX-like permease family protein [Marinoscillum sp.]
MNPNPHIPKWIERLLESVLPDSIAEFVIGDLEEYYALHCEQKGRLMARVMMLWSVLGVCFSFAFKKPRSNSNYRTMLKYYFKLSWRNMAKQKVYSSIKIGGFALGIAATLLIALFVKDELSYDNHYQAQGQIYRILNESTHPEHMERWSAFPPPIKSALENEFPEIEKVGRLINFDWFDAGDNQFRPIEDKANIYENKFVYADPELLEILEIPMVFGNHSALDKPNSIVIARSKAEKYYPGEDPVGKQVILNEDDNSIYTIGGVMEDPRPSTFLQFDFLLTLAEEEFWNGEQTSWGSWNYSVFIKTGKGADYKQLEDKLLVVRDDYVIPYNRERGDQRADDMAQYYQYDVQPVNEIYLYSDDTHDNLQHGDIDIVWLFGSIAIFILLLACINFINLSTAKSANRAKEVGMQKVMGSLKSEVVKQFMMEAFMYTSIAFILGVVIALVSLPFFNVLSDKSLVLPWSEWWVIPGLIAFLIVISVLSGVYPSFYLSAFKPIQVIKGNLSRGAKNSKLRGALVVFQFATSIVLIICTIVTYRQMEFILNKRIGFDKDQVILIQGANTLKDQAKSFKNELMRLSTVNSVSYTDFLPVLGTKRDGNSFWKEGNRKIDKGVGAQKWRVDENYLTTMGINLVQGRNFSSDMASDSTAIIINESMAEELGLEDPIGKRITNSFEPVFHIIGVIEDFHFDSFKREVGPLSLAYGGFGSIMAVKFTSGNTDQMLGQVHEVWDEFMPNQSIRYSFLDDSYALMYDQVSRTGKVFTLFAVLAVVVACLGLFALSAFMVEQRGKEISVRKVLGASMSQIFTLLTSNFVKLVIIAIAIAAPVGWYLMKQWLSDYVYRVEITWDVYLIAGASALVISLITISSESLKAGLMNPVKKLRSE